MKTLLVIEEAKYWGDLQTLLSKVGVTFLGFDKKTPNRSEINQLVAKADFVIIRNRNVAHHSVRFAKEACKMTGTPFWISSNFGIETIINKLNETFPSENFTLPKSPNKSLKKYPKTQSEPQKILQETVKRQELRPYLKTKKKNLPLKKVLAQVKIDDDDIDFRKLFK